MVLYLSLSKTLAHEIGHNLGMWHTWKIENYETKNGTKVPCERIGGIMDYDHNNLNLFPVSYFNNFIQETMDTLAGQGRR